MNSVEKLLENKNATMQALDNTISSLTDEQKERILALVAEKFGVKAGKLVEDIDESILGGFVINVNNKVIDTSIRRQLQEFKMNLK